MRFSTIFVAVSIALSGVHATDPGNNALHAGLSDEVEVAIFNQFGQAAFDAQAKFGCSWTACGLGVLSALPCILVCIAEGNPICVASCISLDKLCPCLDCLPDDVVHWLHDVGICANTFKGQLFAKVYMGNATPEEKAEAQKLGIDSSPFFKQSN